MMHSVAPLMTPDMYNTYELDMPLATHWRRATCADVDCEHWMRGWATTLLEGSDDEALVKRAGRRWSSAERLPGGFIRYTFPPGQACFAATRHRVQLEREPIMILRPGDWRWSGEPRSFTDIADWVDSFANHQAKIAHELDQG